MTHRLLIEARAHLLAMSEQLAMHRRSTMATASIWRTEAEKDFLRALDHAWEVQSIYEPVRLDTGDVK